MDLALRAILWFTALVKTNRQSKIKRWVKPTLILLGLLTVVLLLPSGSIDSWHLFNPKKMVTIVFALTLIQFISSLIIQALGSRLGAVLSGIIGGFISSTATTAALAKRSKHVSQQKYISSESLTFLAATIAMLVEGMAILLFGTKDIHPTLLIIFMGPVLTAALLIFFGAKKSNDKIQLVEAGELEILPVLQLSSFILVILLASKLLQTFFGNRSLLVLTFLVSLFEIHGSFVANIQLHDSGAFAVPMLGALVAISVAASILSKLFLIYALGSQSLKHQSTRHTAYLSVSLVFSWLLFSWVS